MRWFLPTRILVLIGVFRLVAGNVEGAFGGDVGLPVMSFDQATPLISAGQPIEAESHVATRCFDWDGDGDLDLLAACGDGRLWFYRNVSRVDRPEFVARQPVVAGARTRWGNSYSGALLADVLGNELPDLVVAHSGNQISIHENRGTREQATFMEESLSFTVQDNCQGRFDVGDWDNDGLPDLVTGSFGGSLVWYRNQGTPRTPRFNEGAAFHDIRLAYNSHPRIVDFNQDGKLDLLLGVNWGTISIFLNEGTSGSPQLAAGRQVSWAADGSGLNIRELNGDDTTPELCDLDNDGVLDLVSGGKNGRVFLMRGVGFSSRVDVFRAALAEHGGQIGQRLSDDDELRKVVFGALTAIQADLASGLVPVSARQELFRQLAPLAADWPDVLQRQKFDVDTSPMSPVLAAQFWVVLLEALPDSLDSRERVADALRFQGGYRRLLTDLGVVFIDNDTASSEQLATMHQLMIAVPRGVWDVETITVAGWLGEGFRRQKIRSRTGVNIFDLPLGRPENSFAGDSPRPGVTDVYMICLAHELAHNMLDTVGRRLRPELYERKFEGLAQAAGPLVVYQTPKSKGLDIAATKANFKAAGVWDGVDDTWKTAWVEYFKGKSEFDRSYTRGNIQFFLDAPQEAFATLANQYFADSQLMLEFCKSRWDAGYHSNVNQFLLIADYLSDNSNKVRFFVMRPGGDLTVSDVELRRDSKNRIVEVQFGDTISQFRYGRNDLVSEFILSSPRR